MESIGLAAHPLASFAHFLHAQPMRIPGLVIRFSSSRFGRRMMHLMASNLASMESACAKPWARARRRPAPPVCSTREWPGHAGGALETRRSRPVFDGRVRRVHRIPRQHPGRRHQAPLVPLASSVSKQGSTVSRETTVTSTCWNPACLSKPWSTLSLNPSQMSA